MPRRPSFAAAVRSGGLVALEAIRDQIARDLEACESMRDRASLYRRLTDILDRVEQARAAVPAGDQIDQLQRRRAKRLGGPAGTTPRRDLLGD